MKTIVVARAPPAPPIVRAGSPATVAAIPELYAEFRERVVPELRAAGIPVIDANVMLAGIPEPRSLFVDAVHLSPAGHARIADMLSQPVARGVAQVRASETSGPVPQSR